MDSYLEELTIADKTELGFINNSDFLHKWADRKNLLAQKDVLDKLTRLNSKVSFLPHISFRF